MILVIALRWHMEVATEDIVKELVPGAMSEVDVLDSIAALLHQQMIKRVDVNPKAEAISRRYQPTWKGLACALEEVESTNDVRLEAVLTNLSLRTDQMVQQLRAALEGAAEIHRLADKLDAAQGDDAAHDPGPHAPQEGAS
ncbi:hypothetical protein [Lentzea sp. NBRC 105346]|uniref:hypothetical protein n=1 Tax=Lentzea sp. NBRC 105346 TaxID=3032205 RepID=UPI002556CDE2|nr:hypothetical protein [Lentzea sp. NBRC 105346]